MYEFEGYTLDVASGCLRFADRDVELRPKCFDVLHCLVENSGRLVTKEELFKTVWPNVIVSDDVLAQCVSEVRQAIGDSAQKIIRTVPRRGYRFAAPVSRLATGAPASQTGRAAVERGPSQIDAGERIERPLLDRPSVAVLPFANFSGDAQQEYFSDGITEDIITELSRFSELLVIARNSTFQFKGRAVDIRQVGRDLGVRYILEGSVRRDADRVRINVQLIDAVTGAHRWAERYDRELSNVFAVQDEVTRAVVAILAAHVNKAEAERTRLKPPAAWQAYDYYLRGAEAYLLHLSRRSSASLYEARHFLEQSLSIDPNYARAYGMLSWTQVHAYLEPFDDDYLSPTALDRAHELAETAVHLDANLPQARAGLGWVLVFERQHDAAIAEFERALSLNPNFVDHRFAQALAFAGQPERAIQMLEANVRLDPFHPPTRLLYLGHAYYMLGRYVDSVRTLRECASRLPNMQVVHLWLAAANSQSGQIAEARAAAAKVLQINPSFALEKWKCSNVYKNAKDSEQLLGELRKAGLP